MELTVRVRHEDHDYWAEVVELAGCFASGDTLDELKEALEEAVQIYLEGEPAPTTATKPSGIEVAEMKISARGQAPPA